MWLRDALPWHLTGARVLIYGYDSKLAESHSYQNLEDIASRFRASLAVVLGRRKKARPLLFIAHSLGGLVLKQAMIQMASNDATVQDFENLKAIFAIMFFGVPNQGMDNTSLYAMVRGQPNLPFLAYLNKDAGFLHELVKRFREIFYFQDSYVVSFFETKASPTAKMDSTGKWAMCGEPAVLVDRHSAKSGRAWEEQGSYLFPINCTHSDMVKFCEYNDDCEVILNYLKSFVEMAPGVINSRWKADKAQRNFLAPNQTPISPAQSFAFTSPASTSKPNSVHAGEDTADRPDLEVLASEKQALEEESILKDKSSLPKDLSQGPVTSAPTTIEESSNDLSVDPSTKSSTPLHPQGGYSSKIQEAESRTVFDRALEGHHFRERDDRRVGALLITWLDDDMGTINLVSPPNRTKST